MTDDRCEHGEPAADCLKCADARYLAELDEERTERVPRTWRPVDLDDVLSGRYVTPRPTVGRRDDGAGLFYPGRVHSIASESEAGKTWFALIAVRDELAAGKAALYLDFEDDEGGVVGRLMALGALVEHIRDRFAYIRPEDPLTVPGNRDDLAEALGDLRPTLVVQDGVTEAMTLHGLELKDNSDVARFGRLLPRWIAGQGPASVALDHVTKSAEGRGRYALGGVHKLNGINGAAYVLENRVPFGVGRTGKSTVYVAKDRPGQLRRNALAAGEGLFWLTTMEIVSHDESFVETSLSVPVTGDARPRPTALMKKITEALERAGEPLNKQGIEDRVTGKSTYIRQALAALLDEGFVSVATGPRGARLHTLVRRFDEGVRS
ncbi:MAG TPA: AAA family ATPase [Micromonosporaceae bacterium]|nr:AAA family ATPase [Micromonosporaceae bacterium]